MKKSIHIRLKCLSFRRNIKLIFTLLLYFFINNLYAQTIIIKGKITDAQGITLPGVSIRVDGTTSGIISDNNGNYSITAANNATLVFSSVEYTTQRINVNNRLTINVTMILNVQNLSDVVVVGYGTQQRADITGAISSIKGKDFQNIPVQSPIEVMQGRVAGVDIIQNSGAPGSETTVRIRGTTSLNAGNDPLYIVDGVQVSNGLNAVSPNDVESIEVLKDASASAIYGARGANGVVLITTKRGVLGKTSINFNTYAGFSRVKKMIPLLNAAEQDSYIKSSLANGGFSTDYFGPVFASPNLAVNGVPIYDTNWQEALFRSAPVANYDLSILSRTEKSTFSLSLGYFDQDGVVISSGNKIYRGRLSADYNVSSKFKTGGSIIFSGSKQDQVSQNGNTDAVLINALRTLPFTPVYNADGTYFNPVNNRPNPVSLAKEIYAYAQSNHFIGNMYGEYDIFKDLKLRSTLGIDLISGTSDYFTPSTIILLGASRPSKTAFNQTFNWINENTLNYSKSFKGHRITALMGFSMQETQLQAISGSADQAATDIIPTLNAAARAISVSSSKSNSGLLSYYARVNYAFKDKYLLGATIRRDGSSRFGNDNKYGNFPSVSAGWHISNESFMSNPGPISDLKLRASIGVVGNQAIGDYVAQGIYGVGFNYVGKSGISLSTIPNPALSWESTTQTNIGLDVGLIKNRITFSVDAYRKQTNKLLLSVRLPNTTGFSSALENVGNTENKGLEFSVTSQNLVGAFKWSTNFNISFNRSKILTLADNADILQTSADAAFYSDSPVGLGRVGQPIGILYGYVYTGRVYSTTAEALAANMRDGSATGPLYQAGDMIYKDLNGDGIINASDRTIIADSNPKNTGGITNNFSFKGFELSVLMQWSYGGSVYNQTRQTLNRSFAFNTSTTEVLRAWRQQGDITDVPRGLTSTLGRNGFPSTRWIEDGSYLRVKTATVAYNLPAKLLQRIKGLKTVRAYASAQNLLTFTNYSGLDPEFNYQNGAPLLKGIDLGTYPQTRTFLFGINAGF